ncbi:MAG: primosomal protein N' [Armatimonadetes bacterium]|nr:primosomal protein N' [Armatimonadota bacterium]
MPARYAEVAVEVRSARGEGVYTYLVPRFLESRLQVGSHVIVPFGRRRVSGYVVGFPAEAPPVQLKEIVSLLADEPLLTEEGLAMARWVAHTWYAPLTDALRLVLPPGGRQIYGESVELLADDLEELTPAPRQKLVAEALRGLGGRAKVQRLLIQVRQMGWRQVNLDRLRDILRALQERGVVVVQRYLRPPAVRPVTRKHVFLTDPDAARANLTELSLSAPRQALVLQSLLSARRELPLADFSRAAVAALERKGIVRVQEITAERRPEEGLPSDPRFLELSSHQRTVFEHVRGLLHRREFGAVLLHGVTGSGKTEVYLHCLRECLQAGRNAIVLVPEIALTPQVVGRITARFGSQTALLHSALSPGQRYDEWQRIRLGRARIAVGPRSALFAPLGNIGLIVLDEEHESAYKQASSPRYHARDVAFELGRRHNAAVILGSATPSVETYYRASIGEGGMRLFELPERIDARPLPQVRLVDLTQDVVIAEGRTFSEPLLTALDVALSRGEQAILFLNRRGFATVIMCHACGTRFECPDCGISLTYHHGQRRLECHYCGFDRARPTRCDACGSEDIGFLGLGTERVTEQLLRHFPRAVVGRLDRDAVRRRGLLRETLAAFARGEVQVLIGTQMLAKGLDFPGVTLVGVLNADVGLAWPDFRASERTFQLVTQVAGRAGRADKPGLVVVQTYKPEHEALQAAARHDFARFFAHELQARRENRWPPFVHIARLLFTDRDEGRCAAKAQAVALCLENLGIQAKGDGVHYLGPSKAPLVRLRGLWRRHIVLKAPSRDELTEAVERAMAVREIQRAAPLVDIDPLDML